MADRWEEEAERVIAAFESARQAWTDSVLSPGWKPGSEDSYPTMVGAIAEALRRAESSGREAERAECVSEIDRLMVQDRSSIRRQAFGRAASALAARARPGGTNGR